MKKRTITVLILLLCLTGLFGCGPDQEKIQADFSLMVAATPTPEHIKATGAFLDENLERVGEDTAGHMLAAYEEYLLRYTDENTNQMLLETLKPFFDQETGTLTSEQITDPEAREAFDSLQAGNLAILWYEEAPVFRIDYPALLTQFGDMIPESLRLLYELEAEEFRQPISENATLTVSRETLLDRARQAEMILVEYGEDHLVRENTEWLFKTYLNAVLMGTTNSPVFDYQTMEFSPEAKAACVTFIRENPDTNLTWALTEYFTYLDSIDYSLDYNDVTMSKVFFDTCDWLVTETTKRVEQ